MADVKRGKRPLSPHLQIYRPQLSSGVSIFHRVTGVSLALGGVLVVWWLIAAATGPDYFATVDGLLTSWIGNLILLGSSWALCYHLLSGIRHLFWDMGFGFELETADRTAIGVIVGSGVLTILFWLVA